MLNEAKETVREPQLFGSMLNTSFGEKKQKGTVQVLNEAKERTATVTRVATRAACHFIVILVTLLLLFLFYFALFMLLLLLLPHMSIHFHYRHPPVSSFCVCIVFF